MRPSPSRLRTRLRIALAVVATALVIPFGYVTWDVGVAHNFGAIEPGRIYRSGQMPAADLTRTLHDHRIKTVLNLRGVNPRQPWYRAEREATNAAGATQVDISLSSSEWMSREQLRTLLRVIDSCDYPLLIHCQWGSERTGLVSAFVTLLRSGATLEDARAQLSLAYLYVRVGDGKVMAEHLDQYESWLREHGCPHSAATFRQWANEGFQPGNPSREQWPYDPYPLVITRPASASVAKTGDGTVRR
jgi:protein tyrosine phosphatase (PTP) superfamily phosphohydrolase (DUF442 family)